MPAGPTSPTTLITGGSRGIGRAIATALARDGHRLFLVARDAGRLAATADQLRAGGAAVETLALDLRAPAAAERAVDAAAARFGGLTAVVSNAGTAPAGRIETTSPDTLRETFDLHVAAPFALARAAVPAMRQRGDGCLLHVASTAGLRGYPFTAAYTAGKHGMVGLARALALELLPAGIQVYALCPGFVDTDITRNAAAEVAARGRLTAAEAFARLAAQNRLGRMHSVDEVAAAAAWLLRARPPGCVYDLDRSEPAFID